METFEPVQANKLTYDEKQKAIASLMFLTQKRDDSIKAQACADGQEQRAYTKKIDAALQNQFLLQQQLRQKKGEMLQSLTYQEHSYMLKTMRK